MKFKVGDRVTFVDPTGEYNHLKVYHGDTGVIQRIPGKLAHVWFDKWADSPLPPFANDMSDRPYYVLYSNSFVLRKTACMFKKEVMPVELKEHDVV